jgi:hypothetical protein
VKHAGTVPLSHAARRAVLSSARVSLGVQPPRGLQLPIVTVASSTLVPNAASSNGHDVRIIDQQTAKHWQPDDPAVPVVPHVRSRLRLTFQHGPPVSVLHPIGGRHPQCPVVGPGDHLLANGGT